MVWIVLICFIGLPSLLVLVALAIDMSRGIRTSDFVAGANIVDGLFQFIGFLVELLC